MKDRRRLISRKTSRGRAHAGGRRVRVIGSDSVLEIVPNAIPLIGRASVEERRDMERVIEEDVRLAEAALDRGALFLSVRHALDVSESLLALYSDGTNVSQPLLSRARKVISKVMEGVKKSEYKELV